MVHRGVLPANLRPGSSELTGQGLWRLQFALDRLVAPARVLPRHLPGQRRDRRVHGRPFRPCANSPGASGPAAGEAQQRDRRHQPASPQRPGSNRPRTASTAGRPSPTWAWGSAAAAPPPPSAAPATRRPSTPGTRRQHHPPGQARRVKKSVRWVIRSRCPIPRTLPQEHQQVSSPCQVWKPSWSSSSTSGSFMDRATRVRLVDHHCVADLQLAQSLA